MIYISPYSEKKLVNVSRITIVVVAVIAFILAINPDSSVFEIVSHAWAGFGAAFGPVVLLSLFWKRFTYKGAVAGIIVGALVDMIWLWAPVADGATLTAATGIYEIIPGFIVGGIAAVVVTLIDKEPSQDVKLIYAKATDNSIDD